MEAALGRVGQKAHATSGIMRKLGGAIGAYMGFSAVKGMADFATKMESTRLSMAVLLQSGDKLRGVMTPFGKAATEAGAAWDLIRQAAIQTPATTEQVAAGFNVIAMRARAAGMSLKDMVSLSANLATFDMMSGGKGVVQMDVEQLARGSSGQIATGQLNVIKHELAALGREGKHAEMFKRVSEALALDPETKAAFGASMSGILSTFEDKMNQMKEMIGKPLMETVVVALKGMMEWLEKNEDAVKKIAKTITDILGGAFKAVGLVVKGIAVFMANDLTRGIGLVALAFGAVHIALNAMKAHPVILALTAVAALGGAIGDVFGAENTPQSRFSDASAQFSSTVDHAKNMRKMMEWLGTSPAVRSAAEKDLAAIQMKSIQGFTAAATEAGLQLKTFGSIGKALGIGTNVTAEQYVERVGGATQMFGAGFTPEQFDTFMMIDGKARENRDSLVKSLQALADEANRAQGELFKLGLLPQAMEKNEFGISVAKKGYVTGQKYSVDTQNMTLASSNVNVKQDNRGSKVTLNQKITTNDPSRLAGASLVGAFVGAFVRPMTARFALGSSPLATGGN